MALGALIGAYQEDGEGGLRALLPLAGRTLIEYQARCLAAAGTAPLTVLVERVPPALNGRSNGFVTKELPWSRSATAMKLPAGSRQAVS